MKDDPLSLEYWGLWAVVDGRVVVGYAGCVVIYVAIAWVVSWLATVTLSASTFEREASQPLFKRSLMSLALLVYGAPFFAFLCIWALLTLMGIHEAAAVLLGVLAANLLAWYNASNAPRVPIFGGRAALAWELAKARKVLPWM